MTAMPKSAPVRTPIDASPALKLLPFVLSVTAGSVDVIGFLGMGGLLAAHITGNLVILAAHVVSDGSASIATILSVPVFIAVLAVVRLLAAYLTSIGWASLRPLLGLQFLLLGGSFLLGLIHGPAIDPNAPGILLAGMFCVSAMAVQNALVQISIKDAPATAVMTTNTTRFVADIVEIVLGQAVDGAAKARARRTGPAIVGFAVGCAFGAAAEARFGLWSLALPAGLSFLALGLTAGSAPGASV
jgi:uncharacterized membrane protein YoaK (UPF0700 family)